MSGDFYSFLPSLAILGVVALVAVSLTASRSANYSDRRAERRLLTLIGVTTLLQAGHFSEELATGFHRRFPELLGLPPMSVKLFATFNIVWLVIWILSIPGIRARMRVALFPAWFLGIASVMNGVAHPLLSLASSGYFPGLFTSPLVGISGVFLVSTLRRFTDARTFDV